MIPSSQLSTTIIGKRYLLQGKVGQGGMGAVFRAQDRLTGQMVALKQVLTEDNSIGVSTSYDQSDFRLALAQEFKLLASLRHPHIIEVIDYGFDDKGQPYYTMELLDQAKTILEVARHQTLETRIELLVQMLQALSYLHRRGILHRDLKPANVLVVDGKIKLLDFGLSVMRDRVSQDDQSDGTTVGTLSYMAPEILVGEPATESSDLYAVGMIAYEMLIGYHPFDTQDIGVLVNHILFTIPEIPTSEISEELGNLVCRLLAKSSNDRFTNARDVLMALQDAVEHPIKLETVETRESFLQAAQLIGRDLEVSQLHDSLKTMLDGHGCSWLIGGENGVGKSRLLDEIRTLALVNGALVMNGHAVGQGRSLYHEWQNVFHWLTLIADLDEDDKKLIQFLVPKLAGSSNNGATLTPQISPGQVQSRLLTRVQESLAEQMRPVVMIFEDLHWAGDESLELLSQVHRITSEMRLMIIASFRDDERPELTKRLPEIPLMTLKRLDNKSIAQLSQAMLGEAGNREPVVDLLQRETEGNVFFLIEVIRVLAEEAGDLSEIGKMTLPPQVFAGGVNLVVQRRLQRIPQWAQFLLQIAAIFGRRQDINLLRTIATDIDVDQWLMECSTASVMEVQDGVWQFSQDKMRDVLIQNLTPVEKQALHRRVALAIEAMYAESEHITELAYHWRMANDSVKEAHYVLLAGNQALIGGVYREALNHFDRVAKLLNAQPTSRETNQQLITLQHNQAQAHLGIGDYEKAEHLYWQSLLLAEQIEDQAQIARSHSGLGDVAHALNKHKTAKQQYEKGLAIFRTLGDQVSIGRILNSLGNLLYDQGDDELAKLMYQESLSISREIGGHWGMAGSATTQEATMNDASSYEIEREQLARKLEEYKRNNDQIGLAQTHYELAKIAYQLEENEVALENYNVAMAIYKMQGDGENTLNTQIQLGRVYHAKADYDNAIQQLTSALRLMQHENSNLTPILMEVARIRIAQKREVNALELLTFILYHSDDLDETIEDEAERLIFQLEEDIAPELVKPALEKGKSAQLNDVIEELLT